MNGYQVTFFTQQDRHHRGKPLAEWLLHLAAEMNLGGATLIPGSEGMGHDRRFHSARFFDLADQPLTVLMVLTTEEADRVFQLLRAEGVHLFYVKTPVEFGSIGDPAVSDARSAGVGN